MIDIQTIYEGAEALINQVLSKESESQGHYLTGALQESLSMKVVQNGKTDTMQGFAAQYATYVDQGVPAESASMAQFPFLVEYFRQRGLSDKEAKGAAAATIHTWMKEGMSTQASKRFSETGSRLNFIENAFVGHADKIDQYMNEVFDASIDEEFEQEKSETL